MTELREEDVAWCAGVIDSLGLIKLRVEDNGTTLPAVHVSTAKAEIAVRLAELTGVGITTVDRDYKRLGCGSHCSEPHLHVRSQTARWSLTGARATVFLRALLPHLRVKTAEAEEAYEAGTQAPWKPATVRKMVSLGWPGEEHQ